MNPLYLYRKVRREALAKDEVTWVADQISKAPYCSLLHLVRARNAQNTGELNKEAMLGLGSLYAHNRRQYSLLMNDKLARQLDTVRDEIARLTHQQPVAEKTLPEPALSIPASSKPEPLPDQPVPPQTTTAKKDTPVLSVPAEEKKPAPGLKIRTVKPEDVDHLPTPPPVTPTEHIIHEKLEAPATKPASIRPPDDPLPTTKTLTDTGSEVASPIELKEVPAPIINQGLQTMIQVRTGMYLPIVKKIGQQLAAYREQFGATEPVLPTPETSQPESTAPVIPTVTPESKATPAPAPEPAVEEPPALPTPEAPTETPMVSEAAQVEEIAIVESPLPTEPTAELPTAEPDKKQERVTLQQLNQEQVMNVEQGVDEMKRNLLELIQAQISGKSIPTTEALAEEEKPAVSSETLSEIDRTAKQLATAGKLTPKHPTEPVIEDLKEESTADPLPEILAKTIEKAVPPPTETPTETPTERVEEQLQVKETALAGSADSMSRFEHPVFDPKPVQLNVGGIERTKNKLTDGQEESVPPSPPSTEPTEQTRLEKTPATDTPESLTTESFRRFVQPEFLFPTPKEPTPVNQEPEPTLPVAEAPSPLVEEKPDTQTSHTTGHIQTESFHRFIAPAFDTRREENRPTPIPESREKSSLEKEPPATEKVEPKQEEVTTTSLTEKSSTSSFGRFVPPSFSTAPLESEPKLAAEPIEKEASAELTLPPAPKPLAPTPTVVAGELTTTSMKRFVSLENYEQSVQLPTETQSPPTPKPVETQDLEKPTEEDTTAPVTETQAPESDTGLRRFVSLEETEGLLPEEPQPKESNPTGITLEEPAVLVEETPAPQQPDEQTFTYRKGDISLEIVLRPDQLKFFKQDPKTLFQEAAEEVLVHEATHGTPDAQITIDREKAVLEQVASIATSVPQLGALPTAELAKMRTALSDETWDQLLAAFNRLPISTETVERQLPLGSPVSVVEDTTLTERLKQLTEQLNTSRATNLEATEQVFGQVLDLHQDEEQELLRNYGLSTLYSEERLSSKQLPSEEQQSLIHIGGAAGDFNLPDERDTNLAGIQSLPHLPHPNEITLKSIQQKFLSKVIGTMTGALTMQEAVHQGVEGSSMLQTSYVDTLPQPQDTQPLQPQTSVDQALLRYGQMESTLSLKLTELREKAGTQDPEEAAAPHPDTLTNPLEEEGEVSETLAQILAKQGKIEEARAIYARLGLKHPEKSAYFADLIQKLSKA